MLLPITMTAAAAAALIHVWLSLRVSQVRTAQKIMIGDGGSEALTRRMRAHANFAENAPIFLLLLLLLELGGTQSLYLWAAVLVFVLARLLHPFGMDRKAPNIFRMLGTLGSLAVIAALAIWGIKLSYSGIAAPAPERMEVPGLRVDGGAPAGPRS